jgi:hypothetical protein
LPPTRPLTSALDCPARSPRAFAGVCSRPASREVGTRPPGGSAARVTRVTLLLLTPRYPRCINRQGDSSNPWVVVRSVSGRGKTGLDCREGMLRQEGFCPAYALPLARVPTTPQNGGIKT